jgi:hypothetical protein
MTGRVLATVVIWIAFSAMTVSLFTAPTGAISNADGAELFGIVLVLSIAAFLSTTAIWRGEQGSSDRGVSDRAKAKRTMFRERSRIERLVERLDDDEIYELEALLLGQQEEARRRDRSGQ